jgi:hypothetical protein
MLTVIIGAIDTAMSKGISAVGNPGLKITADIAEGSPPVMADEIRIETVLRTIPL